MIAKFLGLRNWRPSSGKALAGVMVCLLCVLCGGLFMAGCEDSERALWVTIRDADAAVETMTTQWEAWRDESPRTFSDAELERLRAVLTAANEAVAAGEGAFSAYWETKKLVAQGKAPSTSLAEARAKLVAANDAINRAVAAAREFFTALSRKKSSLQLPASSIELAGADISMLYLIVALLGPLMQAYLGGKVTAITEVSLKLIAAVMDAHKQATGEDIDLELPALRKRIADRRARLAKK